MATMTRTEPGGACAFVVPMHGRQPDAPFATGHAELLIDAAGPEHRAHRVALRFYPDAVEFRLKLPRLVAGTALAPEAAALARSSATGRPVVTYEADAGVAAQLDPGLDGLAALEAMLATIVPTFEPGRYALASITFLRDAP